MYQCQNRIPPSDRIPNGYSGTALDGRNTQERPAHPTGGKAGAGWDEALLIGLLLLLFGEGDAGRAAILSLAALLLSGAGGIVLPRRGESEET